IATGISKVGPSQMASSCRASSHIARCSSSVVLLPPKASPSVLLAITALLIGSLRCFGAIFHCFDRMVRRRRSSASAKKRVHFFAIRIESTLRGFFISSAVFSLVVADGLCRLRRWRPKGRGYGARGPVTDFQIARATRVCGHPTVG